uniref:MADF domain-containing protein n=1 Tax=Meloidogyne javanica TaxID=6303 RepID=A0A915MFA2_MELJA
MKRRSYGRWINKEDEVFDEEIEETEKIQKKAMKQEIVEGEREGSNTTITATIMAISPNDQFYEFSNISEENPVPSKTTQKNNILMAAQLGMKGPPPSGEQPVDKMFNSQLIKEISQHPALFDFTCDEYKSIEARNRNWDEVSSHSCQPLEFVRTRWKTLRDRFKKEVRRIKQQQLQQPENAFIGCWHHFEEMLFLLPFVRDKAEEVVSHSKEGEGEATSSPADVTTSAQALIQAYTLAKQLFGENEDDEDKLFCRIVLKKLGKLDERLKDTAKIKIMELLLKLQYGECNNNTTSNSSGR